MPYIVLYNPEVFKSKSKDAPNHIEGEDWFIFETEEEKDKFLDKEFSLDAGESIYVLEIDEPTEFRVEITTELKEVKK